MLFPNTRRHLEEEDELRVEEEEEEELVKEVLRDFPPEEKGEREEWKDHVGWHRKENIRKRIDNDGGRLKHKQGAAEANLGKSLRQNHEIDVERNYNSTTFFHPMVMISSILLLVGFILIKLLRKRNKHRTL
jgi:hypothetical protein